MWGRIWAAEAWKAASFFFKPENSQGGEGGTTENLEVKTNKNDNAVGFLLLFFIF